MRAHARGAIAARRRLVDANGFAATPQNRKRDRVPGCSTPTQSGSEGRRNFVHTELVDLNEDVVDQPMVRLDPDRDGLVALAASALAADRP